MSLIDISGLTFAYDGSYDNIFENVSFRIDTDWKLGFTGRNGRGKTTFLKLLMGKYEYKGSIAATVGLEYFPYEVSDDGLTTGLIIDEVCPDCPRWQVSRELSLLEIDEEALERPFYTLSNGERVKVLLAAMFLKENNFLLIDEPTNHLDMAARGVVSDYLRSKNGFILVSHDRAFLDGCVDHILSINRADIEIQRGNFSSWFENRERQDNSELAENQKLKKDIKRLAASARRVSDWSDKVEKSKYNTKNSGLSQDRGYVGHKAAKMMKRSKSIETRRQTAYEDKSKLLKNIENRESLKLTQPSYRSGRLASLSGVSVAYGEKAVCSDIGFVVEQGDRIALCGRNGSGKSSIIKLLYGEDIPHTGQVQKGSGLKISYVSQDTSFLRGDLSEYASQNGVDESLFKAILRKLGFSRTQLEKNMADFSGGQKKKVLIAGSLCESAHLLLWDEPLNFIDVISRMQIEELLLEHKPTVVFVEHDAVFCEKIATKRVLL